GTRLGNYLPILEQPEAKQLTRLSLIFNGVNLEEIAAFVKLDVFQNLNSLLLLSQSLRDATVRTLAEAKTTSNLRSLRLVGSPDMTDESACYLAASPHLAKLERLSLAASSFPDAAAKTIAKSQYLRNLTDLDFSFSRITEAGVKALTQSPNLPRLT